MESIPPTLSSTFHPPPPRPRSSASFARSHRGRGRRPPLPSITITSIISGKDRGRSSIHAMVDLSTAAAAAPPPPPVDITWQITVGSLAGITPFIVAGIEFSKRIMAQRRCEICRGSGLVLQDDYHIRCPNCGGFLPWQSWKRFFTG